MHLPRVKDYRVDKSEEIPGIKICYIEFTEHSCNPIQCWMHSGCSSVLNAFSRKLRWTVPGKVCFVPEKDNERAGVQGHSSECPRQSPLPAEYIVVYLVLCDSLPSLLSLYSRLKWVAHSPRSHGMLSGVTWLAASAGYRFPWQFWESQK